MDKFSLWFVGFLRATRGHKNFPFNSFQVDNDLLQSGWSFVFLQWSHVFFCWKGSNYSIKQINEMRNCCWFDCSGGHPVAWVHLLKFVRTLSWQIGVLLFQAQRDSKLYDRGCCRLCVVVQGYVLWRRWQNGIHFYWERCWLPLALSFPP